MSYSLNDIEKIIGLKTWSKKKKIDELLKIDAELYCNLGNESSKTEVKRIKKQSRKIYRAIKKVDEYSGRLLLREQ
tara:strand:- start:257 stop:484 length:228 start_codon:yes stop_codon:yes gene_type:complete